MNFDKIIIISKNQGLIKKEIQNICHFKDYFWQYEMKLNLNGLVIT